MNKRLLPFIIIALLILTLPIALFVTHTSKDIRQRALEGVSLEFESGSYNVGLNSQFEVNLDVDTAGQAIAGVKAVIRFDNAVLQAESVSKPTADAFLPNEELRVIDNNQGTASINVLSNPNFPVSGTGRAVTIRFRAIAAGSSLLEITDDSVVVGAQDPYKSVNLLTHSPPPAIVIIGQAGM